MEIQQIRNATIVVNYADKKWIIDPWFQKKGMGMSAPSPDLEKAKLPSPMVELPMPVEKIMAGVDAIVVTHIHPDHFEPETAAMLKKQIPVFVPDENTKLQVESFGYQYVTVLTDKGVNFGDATLIRTEGMHGEVPEQTAGQVCGIVFTAKKEKTLYVAGDTVYYRGVEEALNTYHPDVVVVNACGAVMLGVGRLIMDAEDVCKTCKAAPYAVIIASHMEAVNHATVTRAELELYLKQQNLDRQVRIPNDGECYHF